MAFQICEESRLSTSGSASTNVLSVANAKSKWICRRQCAAELEWIMAECSRTGIMDLKDLRRFAKKLSYKDLGAAGCCWVLLAGCGVRALQSALCPMLGRTRAMHATSHAPACCCLGAVWVLLGAVGCCWCCWMLLGAAGCCWVLWGAADAAGCCWVLLGAAGCCMPRPTVLRAGGWLLAGCWWGWRPMPLVAACLGVAGRCCCVLSERESVCGRRRLFGCEPKRKALIHTPNSQADPYPRSETKRRWTGFWGNPISEISFQLVWFHYVSLFSYRSHFLYIYSALRHAFACVDPMVWYFLASVVGKIEGICWIYISDMFGSHGFYDLSLFCAHVGAMIWRRIRPQRRHLRLLPTCSLKPLVSSPLLLLLHQFPRRSARCPPRKRLAQDTESVLVKIRLWYGLIRSVLYGTAIDCGIGCWR